MKAFLLRSGIRQVCPLLPLLFNILEVLARPVSQEKEIKLQQIGEEEVTLSFCRLYDHMCRKSWRLHVETVSSNTWIQQIAGYRAIFLKIRFLYTMNYLKKKLKNNSTYNRFNIIKHLGMNSAKEVKDLCKENYKRVLEKVRRHW